MEAWQNHKTTIGKDGQVQNAKLVTQDNHTIRRRLINKLYPIVFNDEKQQERNGVIKLKTWMR